MKIITTIILATCSLSLFGQSGSFVQIPTDAQALVFGGANMHHNHAGNLFSHAAALSAQGVKSSVFASYSQWNNNLSHNYQLYSIAGSYRKEANAFAVGYRQYNLPQVIGYDEMGNSNGSFIPQEKAFDVAYSRSITDRISGGITWRYIYSDIAAQQSKKASAWAIDLGAMYRTEKWQADFSVNNLGGKLDYGYEKNQIPVQVRLGGNYRWKNRIHSLTGGAHLVYQLMPSDYSGVAVHVGAEYMYGNMWIVNIGHRFADKEKIGSPYTALGAGISLRYFTINATYLAASNDSPLKSSMQYSLVIKL